MLHFHVPAVVHERQVGEDCGDASFELADEEGLASHSLCVGVLWELADVALEDIDEVVSDVAAEVEEGVVLVVETLGADGVEEVVL